MFLLCGCDRRAAEPVDSVGVVKTISDLRPTVLLISLDGFHADYLEKTSAPTLQRLAESGVRAKWLIPAFPTKTFPNHYTIATGLYPEHHGIVANTMYDPVFDATFTLGNREITTQIRWWSGEPVWVTAEKQSQRSGTMFWPGSEAEIAGKRPSHWLTYDGKLPNAARVDTVLHWLDLPVAERPTFLTLYFSDADDSGHRYGPDAPEILQAIHNLDSAVARLCTGLQARGVFDQINLIIVSDHGMTGVSPERMIFIDDYIDLESVRIADLSAVTAIFPKAGKEEEVIQEFTAKPHPHLQVYRKSEVPSGFHYQASRRISPVVLIADEGWSISTHHFFEVIKAKHAGGAHGYDNQLPSMRALFIAHGPAFKQGATTPPFENVHLYELICHLLSLTPAANDGSLDSVRSVLR